MLSYKRIGSGTPLVLIHVEISGRIIQGKKEFK